MSRVSRTHRERVRAHRSDDASDVRAKSGTLRRSMRSPGRHRLSTDRPLRKDHPMSDTTPHFPAAARAARRRGRRAPQPRRRRHPPPAYNPATDPDDTGVPTHSLRARSTTSAAGSSPRCSTSRSARSSRGASRASFYIVGLIAIGIGFLVYFVQRDHQRHPACRVQRRRRRQPARRDADPRAAADVPRDHRAEVRHRGRRRPHRDRREHRAHRRSTPKRLSTPKAQAKSSSSPAALVAHAQARGIRPPHEAARATRCAGDPRRAAARARPWRAC